MRLPLLNAGQPIVDVNERMVQHFRNYMNRLRFLVLSGTETMRLATGDVTLTDDRDWETIG